jgi:hypothetical protein
MADGKKAHRKAGAPCKFNEERAAKMISYIRAGSFVHEAAAAAGVTQRTYNNWLTQGRKKEARDNSKFRKFAEDIDQALAQFRVVAVRKISGSKDWRGPAHMLALHDPKTYGIKTRIGIEFEEQKLDVFQTIQEVLGPDALHKVAAALAAKTALNAARDDNRSGSGDADPDLTERIE